MSEVCTHGNLKRQCETCAAWESAVHNQRRAEEAEARVKDLEAKVNNGQRLLRLAAGFLMTTNAHFKGLSSPAGVLDKLALMLVNLAKEEQLTLAERIAKDEAASKGQEKGGA